MGEWIILKWTNKIYMKYLVLGYVMFEKCQPIWSLPLLFLLSLILLRNPQQPSTSILFYIWSGKQGSETEEGRRRSWKQKIEVLVQLISMILGRFRETMLRGRVWFPVDVKLGRGGVELTRRLLQKPGLTTRPGWRADRRQGYVSRGTECDPGLRWKAKIWEGTTAEMAPRLKALVLQAQRHEFDSWNPHESGRRELTPKDCPLISHAHGSIYARTTRHAHRR